MRTFGFVIEALRASPKNRIASRKGWNGKGMWIAYTPPSEVRLLHPGIRGACAIRAMELLDSNGDETHVKLCGHIDMRAADGSVVIGWLASQSDMLAEDWTVFVADDAFDLTEVT